MEIDTISSCAVNTAASNRQTIEWSIEPHTNLGMLNPNIGDGRVVHRATNTIVLYTVDAVGDLALNGEIQTS